MSDRAAKWELYRFEKGEPGCGLPVIGIVFAAMLATFVLSALAAALQARAHRMKTERGPIWIAEVAVAARPALALPAILLVN